MMNKPQEILWKALVLFVLGPGSPAAPSGNAPDLEIAGLTVTPHVIAQEMRYRRPRDGRLGARVELFLRNRGEEMLELPATFPLRFRRHTPEELLSTDEWAWYDLPSAWPGEDISLPPGSLSVWAFNGKYDTWGTGTDLGLEVGDPPRSLDATLEKPRTWISAVTFLSDDGSPWPARAVLHVVNASDTPLRLLGCRLWLPESNATWRVLLPRDPVQEIEAFPPDRVIPAGDRGGFRLETGRLPLTYTAIEVRVEHGDEERSLWAHLRIKREAFDLSGGWVSSDVGGRNSLHLEPYLKTLQRMHIDTGHIAEIPGYTDQDGPEGLYTRYPLKYFHKLQPLERYDRDEVLPRIHAVEFLGEPQYGGGRPVPPMKVFRELAPYRRTRLPTTVTHSEERTWRFYAGLSDYPHYDAYRVTAPAADSWRMYDRWGGERIRWGAPLETIGAMCRSLRELSRPAPTAYWSQGAHAGWSRYGGRQRASPTPDELRLQAYHALSSRITSLYWFNLSLKSIVKFRDLIAPITRVGREIRMLEDLYLEGNAHSWERVERDGSPDWDLATVAGPGGAMLFALDLDYTPDPGEKVFRFGEPRPVKFRFRLPAYLRQPKEVFRVDADGVHSIESVAVDDGVMVTDTVRGVAVYVAAPRAGLRAEIAARHEELLVYERSFGFDPAADQEDFAVLQALLSP
jgi:hypothetical protein